MHKDDFSFFILGLVLYDCSWIGLSNVPVSMWQQLQDSLLMSSGGLAVHFTFFFLSGHNM